MKRFVLLSVIALSGCATSLETANLQLPDGAGKWKAAGGSERRGQTIAEFVPRDESVDNWSQLLTIQFIEQRGVSPLMVMDQLKSKMQSRCPGSMWRIIQQDSLSVLYEWSIASCGGNPDQHEIARLLKGNDGIQRVAIATKSADFSPSDREQWVRVLFEAYVVKDGHKVVAAP
jgi:hypothetical protein